MSSTPGVHRTAAAQERRASTVASAVGSWVGTITGRDMVSLNGVVEPPVRMTLDGSGRWTLRGGGVVVAGTAHPRDDVVVLEGVVVGGDAMTVGRSVSFVLQPDGHDSAYGHGQLFYLGHRVDVSLLLRRVPAQGARQYGTPEMSTSSTMTRRPSLITAT